MPSVSARGMLKGILTRARAYASIDAWPSSLRPTRRSANGYRTLAQMQVEPQAHLVYEVSVLVWRRFRCAQF